MTEWNWTKVASRAAATVVAGVAGYSSYRHIVTVATRAGEHKDVAVLLPLAIDGLIVVGTMAMLEDKRAGRAPRTSARVALAAGIVATVAANIGSAEPTLTARAVAAVPAVAFLIAVEVLTRSGKPVDKAAPAAKDADPAEPPAPLAGEAPARPPQKPAEPRKRAAAKAPRRRDVETPRRRGGGAAGVNDGSKKAEMHAFFLAERAKGRMPSLADMDRHVGSSGLAKVYRPQWVADEARADEVLHEVEQTAGVPDGQP